jgi:hypothetical protein
MHSRSSAVSVVSPDSMREIFDCGMPARLPSSSWLRFRKRRQLFTRSRGGMSMLTYRLCIQSIVAVKAHANYASQTGDIV